MVRLKELTVIQEEHSGIRPGNLACAGCGLNLSFRHAMSAVPGKAIVTIPACCTSVVQGMGDGYGFNVPVFNTAFAAAPAVASGIVHALRRQGRDDVVITWAGDGGTADIGLAALSGAASRNEDMIYIMYDNSGYQNTGNQKSSSTPRGAKTQTTPTGYTRPKKIIANMMISQGVEYVATASAGYPQDLYDKVKRAAEDFKGVFRFIQIDSPCPPGWGMDSRFTPKVSKLAVSSGIWPLYEYVGGKLELSRVGRRFEKPERRTGLEEYFEIQGRFKGITPEQIEEFKQDIDRNWKFIRDLM